MDREAENVNSFFARANKVKVGSCSETVEEATLTALNNYNVMHFK